MRETQGRSYRRFQRGRLSAKRKRYWGGTIAQLGPKWVGRAIDTPAPCSCHVCGNYRQHEGPSIQERKLFQRQKDE